ncbi:MAG: glycosyltransferase [Chthoniobacterales bacterium]
MTYTDWIVRYDTLTPEKRAELRREVYALSDQPLISILLPVYNADLRFLDEAIASVRRQIYDKWELCIADDASTNLRVRSYLEALAWSDTRIKLLFREVNGHISACSNSALTLASGDWCALLDQDDALAENALAEVACAIAGHADPGIIYSDEDFLDSLGARSNPFFKPDWNPELFLGQNYLNHLGVYRTSLLREIGGFREGFEGSQDYDLALRCRARLRPDQILHVPRILYHWRMIVGSLADQPDAKPYARHAARRALNSYLRECGIAAQAEACPENAESHRVIYELPVPFPSVTILLMGRDRPSSLERTDYPALEFILAEPGAAGANFAARNARGEVLVFLSGEIEVIEPSWLREMVSHAIRLEVGAVGARLWSADGNLDDGDLILGLGGIAAPAFRGFPRGHPGYFNRAWLQQNCSAVSAACMVMRKEAFTQLDGFDERNLSRRFFDVDFCLRLRQRGLQVVWTPYANLIFRGSGSREESQSSAEAVYMQKQWGPQLRNDPFYNPNLSLDPPGFGIAFPPRPNDINSGQRPVR